MISRNSRAFSGLSPDSLGLKGDEAAVPDAKMTGLEKAGERAHLNTRPNGFGLLSS